MKIHLLKWMLPSLVQVIQYFPLYNAVKWGNKLMLFR